MLEMVTALAMLVGTATAWETQTALRYQGQPSFSPQAPTWAPTWTDEEERLLQKA